MAVKFRSTFSAAKRITEIKERNRKRLDTAMVDAKAQILTRTAAGQGAEGDLTAYSPSYAKYKASKGRRVDKVDLRLTGQMLKAMQTAVVDNGEKLIGRIYFLAQEAKKAFWNQQLRPNFFKLSSEQIQTIKRKLRGQ